MDLCCHFKLQSYHIWH